jgi:hypothetical protein
MLKINGCQRILTHLLLVVGNSIDLIILVTTTVHINFFYRYQSYNLHRCQKMPAIFLY